jgi:hypothetical protein
MNKGTDLSTLPPDLVSLLTAIGKEMGARRLTPELVQASTDVWRRVVADTEFQITHGTMGSIDAHHYIVEAYGSRWAGALWRFRSGEFERLCRAAAGNVS